MKYRVLTVILSLCVILSASSILFAADDYNTRIDTFFTRIKAGNVAGAVDYIYSGNPYINKKSESVEGVKSQLTNLTGLIGAYKSHTLIIEKKVADRFVYLYYFVAYERQPVAFIFQFYKPDTEWTIFSFAFDSEFDVLIDKYVKEEMFEKD